MPPIMKMGVSEMHLTNPIAIILSFASQDCKNENQNLISGEPTTSVCRLLE